MIQKEFENFYRPPPDDPELLILPILFIFFTYFLLFSNDKQYKKIVFLTYVYDVGNVDRRLLKKLELNV